MNATRLLLTLALACLVGLELAEAGHQPKACRELTDLDLCSVCCKNENYEGRIELDKTGKCLCNNRHPDDVCRGIKSSERCHFCCRELNSELSRFSLASRLVGDCRCRPALNLR